MEHGRDKARAGSGGDSAAASSHYAQTVSGGTTKCLETLAFPGVGGWVGGAGGEAAGSSELHTDRLVGTGVPASWRHVMLIINTGMLLLSLAKPSERDRRRSDPGDNW